MGTLIVSEPTLKLSLTNGVTLNEYSWWSNLANTFTPIVAWEQIPSKGSHSPEYLACGQINLNAVLRPPRPMSGYNRNLTLQEQ